MPPRKFKGYRRRGAKDPIDNSFSAPPFNPFDPHDGPAPYYNGESIIVTSVDPGIKNCAIYVQKINLLNDKKTSIFLTRMDFNQDETHITSSIKMLEKLEKDMELFSRSQYILVEKQMTMSIPNTRMGQHLITLFCRMVRNKGKRPIILEITPKAKTKVLKCPAGMKKYEYKKWCVNKAIELLESRDNDYEEKFITCIECATKGKKDDMGDVICQSEAFARIVKSDIFEYPKPIKGKPPPPPLEEDESDEDK